MNNLNALTRSHSAIAAKKRAKRETVKEIVFNDADRREFLTGFHKRKLAKADAARKKAAERDKQYHLEARREHRRMLRERAAENAVQVESAYGGTVVPLTFAHLDADDDEWTGISALSSKGKQKQQEYEDDEVLATVAVVEDFDPDSLIHGTLEDPNSAPAKSVPRQPRISPPQKSSSVPASGKSRPKKIRYQTKDARKQEKSKQHARRHEKAELAGGKASRRMAGPGGKKGKGKK